MAKPKPKTKVLALPSIKIVAAAHDNKKRVTHVQLESGNVYTYSEIVGFIKNKQYTFVAQAPNKIDYAKVDVRSGKNGKFLTTLKNKTREDNLDYLPALLP